MGASDTIFSYGPFEFRLSTLSPDRISRSSNYNWAENEVFSGFPVLHYTGVGTDRISFSGVTYPINYSIVFNRNVYNAMSILRLAAENGAVYPLFCNGGNIGDYAIASLEETGEYFTQNGIPQKQTFNIEFLRYAPYAPRPAPPQRSGAPLLELRQGSLF